MHFMRSDLDFHCLRAGSDDRRMNRTVPIVLRGRDVVVEFPGNELPQRVHHTQRRIAFRNGVHEDACGANVHELLEGELFGVHLAPNAIDVFRPPLDRRVDACVAQFAAQKRLQLFHVALAFGTPHLESGGDALVVAGLKISECEVFQLPLQLPHTQSIGERRIDFAGFGRELALQDRIERLGGTHFLQLSGEAHDHQSHVTDDGQQHLAQCLGLTGFEALFGRPIRP